MDSRERQVLVRLQANLRTAKETIIVREIRFDTHRSLCVAPWY